MGLPIDGQYKLSIIKDGKNHVFIFKSEEARKQFLQGGQVAVQQLLQRAGITGSLKPLSPSKSIPPNLVPKPGIPVQQKDLESTDDVRTQRPTTQTRPPGDLLLLPHSKAILSKFAQKNRVPLAQVKDLGNACTNVKPQRPTAQTRPTGILQQVYQTKECLSSMNVPKKSINRPLFASENQDLISYGTVPTETEVSLDTCSADFPESVTPKPEDTLSCSPVDLALLDSDCYDHGNKQPYGDLLRIGANENGYNDVALPSADEMTSCPESTPTSSPASKKGKFCKWGDEFSTRLFISTYTNQAYLVHPNVWTDQTWSSIAQRISEKLGKEISAEQCRSRRRALNENFRRKKQTKTTASWPLYDDVLKMRQASPEEHHAAVPSEVVSHKGQTASVVHENPPEVIPTSGWPEEIDAVLIDEYMVRKQTFEDGKTRHNHIWEEICEAVREQADGFPVTREGCKKQFALLRRIFNAKKRELGTSGNGGTADWPHFEAMWAILKDNVIEYPRVICSVGSGNQRIVRPDDELTATPTSRTGRDRAAMLSGRKRRSPKTRESTLSNSAGASGTDARLAALQQTVTQMANFMKVYKIRTEHELGITIDL